MPLFSHTVNVDKVDELQPPKSFFERKIASRKTASIVFLIFAALLVTLFEGMTFEQELVLRWLGTAGMRSVTVNQIQRLGNDPPISMPTSFGPNARLSIHFEFKVASTAGYQNLFQTSDTDNGLRAEMSGSSIGMVYPMPFHPGAIKSVGLYKGLVPGRWYSFDLVALPGQFFDVHIGDGPPARTWTEHPEFKIDDILVGQGYDRTRLFRGEMRDIHIQLTPARSAATRQAIYRVIRITNFAIFLGIFYLGLRRNSVVPAPQVAVISKHKTVRKDEAYDALLTLRAVAFLMVFLGHSFMIGMKPPSLESGLKAGKPVWLITGSPWGGVWIFFILSGYLMGKGFFAGRYSPTVQGIYRFYKNRLLRIAPLYWVSLFLVAILVTPAIFRPQNLYIVVRILTFDYDAQQPIHPISALWSVSTEMHFYLLVPLLFIGLRFLQKRLWLAPLLYFVVLALGLSFRTGIISRYGWELWPREVYETLLGNIDLFLGGFLLNPLIQRCRATAFRLRFGIPLGFLALLGLYCASAWISGLGGVLERGNLKMVLFTWTPTLVLAWTSMIICLFELGMQGNPGGFFIRALKRTEIFGLLTYALYVAHEPIMNALDGALSPVQNWPQALLRFLVLSALVLIAAVIAYNFIELPFERKKKY